MIARLPNCVENQIAFHFVVSSKSIIKIHARARSVEAHVVVQRRVRRDGLKKARGLLPVDSEFAHQVVGDVIAVRILCTTRHRSIDPHRAADEHDSAVARKRKLVPNDAGVEHCVREEQAVAANLIEETTTNRDVASLSDFDRTSTVDRPIAAGGNFVR